MKDYVIDFIWDDEACVWETYYCGRLLAQSHPVISKLMAKFSQAVPEILDLDIHDTEPYTIKAKASGEFLIKKGRSWEELEKEMPDEYRGTRMERIYKWAVTDDSIPSWLSIRAPAYEYVKIQLDSYYENPAEYEFRTHSNSLDDIPIQIKVYFDCIEEPSPDLNNNIGLYNAECGLFKQIYGVGNTKKEAFISLIQNIIGYSLICYENFNEYSENPCKKKYLASALKFLYILLRGDDLSEIIEFKDSIDSATLIEGGEV